MGFFDFNNPESGIKKGMSMEWPNSRNESTGPVLLDSQTIRNRIRELGSQIAGDYQGKTPHLVAVLKGASIFHADLVRAMELPLSFDFIAVGSYGTQGTSSGEVRILKDLEDDLEGKDVLLVEDIVDTGLTLHSLVQNLQERKPQSLKIVALLNKPAGRKINVPVDYIGFHIPDAFVVGYGLDYDQRYRNLPDIHILYFGT
jgi:hypoxanthine phosphoribosyltransferase